MKGQKVVISNLTEVMYRLTSNSFLFLTVSGLLNPKNSVRQANFTFTFINTTSSYTQASLLFTLPLSYTISDAPQDIQIESILLSNDKYLSVSTYSFVISSLNSHELTISRRSQLGVIVDFPEEYQ